nr:hypothetical protein [uncultured Psychroserpens sp.]
MKLIKQISLLFFILTLSSSFINTKEENKIIKETNVLSWELEDNVHLVTEVTRNVLSLENVTEVTYKLYVSQNTGISKWETVKKPDYKGFESEEIDVMPLSVKTGGFKNEKYRYVVLSKTKLTPIEKGEFQIEPLKLNITLETPSNKRNLNGGMIMETINKDFESEPVTITVK